MTLKTPRTPEAWRRLRVRLAASLAQSTIYSRANMRMFAIVAIIGHPLYYLCWTEFQPQGFESAWLRAFSVLIAIPMLFEHRLTRHDFWRRKVTLYWFFIVIYQLPFFFIFMSLMNEFATVWALSTMAACLLMVLIVFDWLMILVMAALGAGAACAVYELVGGDLSAQSSEVLPLVPTYVFAILAGSAFNYKTELVSREKLSAITSAGARRHRAARTRHTRHRLPTPTTEEHEPACLP